MEILLGLAILGLIVAPVILVKCFIKENASLHDRLAARSLDEFNYFKKVYPKEVEAYSKKLDEEADKLPDTRRSPEQIAADDMAMRS